MYIYTYITYVYIHNAFKTLILPPPRPLKAEVRPTTSSAKCTAPCQREAPAKAATT